MALTALPNFMCLQHSFWGWGKEDNNMVRRLQLHHMWPPERPAVQVREKVSICPHPPSVAPHKCMLRKCVCSEELQGSQRHAYNWLTTA